MKIDTGVLTKRLRESQAGDTCPKTEVPAYVMKYIYQPLLRDEKLLFRDLDFSRFDIDGLDALHDYLENVERYSEYLRRLNQVFCSACPASVATRAFC